jgi:hypothetical protein
MAAYPAGPPALRVVADDAALFRQGLCRLVADAGFV